jgi:hypothetical protein
VVIFGSAKTLGGDKLLKGFLDLMNEKGWVMRLKPGAESLHDLSLMCGSVVVKGEAGEQCVDGGFKSEVPAGESGVGGRVIKGGKGILGGRPFVKEVIEVSSLSQMIILGEADGSGTLSRF